MEAFEEAAFEDLLAEAEQFAGDSASLDAPSTWKNSPAPNRGGPQEDTSPIDLGAPAKAWDQDSLLDASQGGPLSLEEQLRALQSQRFSQGQPEEASEDQALELLEGETGVQWGTGKRRHSSAKRVDALSAPDCAAGSSPLTSASIRKRRRQQQQQEQQQQQQEAAVADDINPTDDERELAAAAAALRPPEEFFDISHLPSLSLLGEGSSGSSKGKPCETGDEAARKAAALPQQTNNGKGGPCTAYMRRCLYGSNVMRKFPAALLAKAAAKAAEAGEQQQQQASASSAVACGAVRVLPPHSAGGGSVGPPVYIQLLSRREQQQQLAAAAAAARSSASDKARRPMEELLREIMESQAARREERELQQQQKEQQQQIQEQQQQKRHQQHQQQQRKAARQWVDLYRPKTPLDLLSGDSENRAVFRWLLTWRERILGAGRKVASRQNEKETPQGLLSEEPQQKVGFLMIRFAGKWSGACPEADSSEGGEETGRGDGGTLQETSLEHERSARLAACFDEVKHGGSALAARHVMRERSRKEGASPGASASALQVLLLGGPPGVGKTTLIEVAARHFGFELFEVNGSEARSASTLLPLIKGVASSGDCHFRPSGTSSSSSRKKPVLLLIDEVDGLAHQAAAPVEGEGTAGNKETVVQALVRLSQQRDTNDKPLLKR
ncbi:replication factor C subunit 1-like [Cyclospora cayetanensis]|uniref:Replication factor C subunit 1-like n=1 Tax=Cyclospora cayetanensis TaxID=88456 RepID=A0A6P6S263_9EIME|nr:replication factor C subunit 1-like [Cyclospora cayetanensis]